MPFNLNYKKILLAVGFVLLCVAVGYLIYLLFFKPAPEPEIISGPEDFMGEGELPQGATGKNENIINPPATGLPGRDLLEKTPDSTKSEQPSLADPVAKGGITKTTKISETDSLAPTLSADGNSLYFYNKSDGKFYRTNDRGEKTLLSNKTFYSVQKVNWAPNKQKAILEYPDGANILYDFKSQKQITLPKHWKDFDFSPQSSQIVAKSMGIDPENRWLITANDDGSKATAIEHLGTEGDRVYSSWSPNNQSIALFTESMDFNRQQLYFVGKNHENFKSTIIEGRGLDFQWTPDGERLIYSVYNDQNDLKPELWIVNAKGDGIGSNRQRLNLQTWAGKCALADSNNLYCAVPKSLPEGAGLFSQLAEDSTDNIYKINLQNGSRQLIAIPDGDYNINNITVSKSQGDLYFTDIKTNNIHTIKLK